MKANIQTTLLAAVLLLLVFNLFINARTERPPQTQVEVFSGGSTPADIRRYIERHPGCVVKAISITGQEDKMEGIAVIEQ